MLLLFMAADWITSLSVAGVFPKSPKSKNGALESRIGLKGLCRKGATFLGWSLNGEMVSDSIDVTENVTLLAEWEDNLPIEDNPNTLEINALTQGTVSPSLSGKNSMPM